jgi:hypothetical protein
MIFNFLCIAVIWVVILDLTDFMPTIKGWISSILTKGKSHNSEYRLKPIDCSLCMSWWSILAYIIIVNQLSLVNIMLALLIAWLTPVIKDTLILINTLINTLITKLMKNIYGSGE